MDYETGVRAAKDFADLVAKLPFEATPAQAALAWVAQQDGVTTVIPGARTAAQAKRTLRPVSCRRWVLSSWTAYANCTTASCERRSMIAGETR